MSARQTVQIVVVDDSVRFAFHVWRYLGKSIGVGSGLQSSSDGELNDKDLEERFLPATGPQSLSTADGRFAVWWVPGNEELKEMFAAVAGQISPWRHRFFLIDKRGQPAGPERNGSSGHKGLDLGKDGELLGVQTLGLIQAQFPKDLKAGRFLIVSSYETGTVPFQIGNSVEPCRIWPKSPDTLAQVERKALPPGRSPIKKRQVARKALPSGRRSIKKRQDSSLHILVTGAGFEIRNDETGSFGLPLTGHLLREMGDPFQSEPLQFETKWEDTEFLPRLSGCATKFKDLDRWWNWLLEREIRKLDPDSSGETAEEREQRKVAASACERNMREAFRRVILKYDWGQMNQSLHAADLNWHAWLTTNYTRFADRAIGLYEASHDRQSKKGNEERRWQIISTSIEARSFAREVLHGGHLSKSVAERKARYLFKLHGDVAHLQTMATAGYDKELFNSLSVPMDSLHEVYSAAEIFLVQSLRSFQDGNGPSLVWHLVGHSLNDWILRQLIAKVCRQAGRSYFVVVSPEPTDTANFLKDFLDKSRVAKDLSKGVIPHSAKAEEYLASIRIAGPDGLHGIRSLGALERWLASLKRPEVGSTAGAQGEIPSSPPYRRPRQRSLKF